MSRPTISPELAVLIKSSLLVDDTPFEVEDRPIRWERMNSLAGRHQVRPLLFEYLQNHQIPDKIYQSLKEFSIGQAVANMAFGNISVDLHTQLKKNQISAFVMKGALWAWMLYEKSSLREFGDIDFFVAKSDIQKSLGVFHTYGFDPDEYRSFLLSRSEITNDYLNTDYQLPLIPAREHTLQSLELQWNCSYPRYMYNFTWQELSVGMVDFCLLGKTIQVPKPENQLIMMLVHHAGVEQWEKLKYMADLVRMLRIYGNKLDWKYITAVAENKGFVQILKYSLSIASMLSGIHYPDQLKPLPGNAFDKYLNEILFQWEEGQETSSTKSARILSHNLHYRDNLKIKMAILSGQLNYLRHWRLIWNKWRWYMQQNAK